jgi:xylulokinase
MALYLGLDSSTQGLKAVLIDPAQGRVVASSAVNYGRDLPDYGCIDGVLPDADPLVKHADPLMWLAALDLLLGRMQAEGLPLSEVQGIGGSGQQHGSVYLNEAFFGVVGGLSPVRDLAEQLAPALSRRTSPIWMDSSTSAECAEIAAAVGERLQSTTGSPAIERFTGPQIRKFRKSAPERYRATRRIHLVSSFLCSVLIGGDAPLDSGDGAGMNLLNLNNLQWDAEIAEATAPGLVNKLPRVAATLGRAGGLSAYFSKYGLTAGIPVAVWTGDNPASLVGCGGIGAGSAVVSLGTSDTFFAALDPYRVDPAGFGHVFGHPAGGFMCLTCFKNGSLARERVKDEAGVDWEFFDRTAFERTPTGNNQRWALPWFEAEITPLVTVPGLRANFDFANAAPEVRIRAVVEAQAMALRTHSLWMGEFKTLRVTGGGSQSAGILQTLANVFGAPVVTLANPGSAALGAALIAAHVGGGLAYEALSVAFCPPTCRVEPDPVAVQVYGASLPAFGRFEAEAQTSGLQKF